MQICTHFINLRLGKPKVEVIDPRLDSEKHEPALSSSRSGEL